MRYINREVVHNAVYKYGIPSIFLNGNHFELNQSKLIRNLDTWIAFTFNFQVVATNKNVQTLATKKNVQTLQVLFLSYSFGALLCIIFCAGVHAWEIYITIEFET